MSSEKVVLGQKLGVLEGIGRTKRASGEVLKYRPAGGSRRKSQKGVSRKGS